MSKKKAGKQFIATYEMTVQLSNDREPINIKWSKTVDTKVDIRFTELGTILARVNNAAKSKEPAHVYIETPVASLLISKNELVSVFGTCKYSTKDVQ